MFIIKTKNESYTGEISGVAFLTDIEWFKSYGHTVEETTEEVTTEETNVEEAKTEEVSKNKKGK